MNDHKNCQLVARLKSPAFSGYVERIQHTRESMIVYFMISQYIGKLTSKTDISLSLSLSLVIHDKLACQIPQK